MREELELRSEMHRTHLIQRLHKPMKKEHPLGRDNPFAFGGGLRNGGLSPDAMNILREVFSFDYMGAAEFEFGAVPAAFNFLAKQAAAGTLDSVTMHLPNTLKVYVIAPATYMKEVTVRVHQLYEDEGKFNLHERCGLRQFFHGSDYGKNKGKPEEWHLENCGWLEIDNGYMFFTDKKMWQDTGKLFGLKLK